MENITDWAPTVVAIAATIGVVWRFETRMSGLSDRIAGVETRLSGRISDLSDRVSRIEGLLEGYFMHGGKSDPPPPAE